jgi:hypothetical protein
VYLKTGRAAGKRLLFAANYTRRSIRFTIPEGFDFDLQGSRAARAVVLKPGAWAVRAAQA